jgi:hypothetical protein
MRSRCLAQVQQSTGFTDHAANPPVIIIHTGNPEMELELHEGIFFENSKMTFESFYKIAIKNLDVKIMKSTSVQNLDPELVMF